MFQTDLPLLGTTLTSRDAKKARCRAERRWRKSGLEVHTRLYKQSRYHCTQAVWLAKTDHIQS